MLKNLLKNNRAMISDIIMQATILSYHIEFSVMSYLKVFRMWIPNGNALHISFFMTLHHDYARTLWG